MEVKCPRCNSVNFDLGDYTHHSAYDDVVDSISDDGSFQVWAYCEDCRYVFYINFEITNIEATKTKVDETGTEIDENEKEQDSKMR